MRGILVLSVLLQVAAQTFAGIWGAPLAGAVTGLLLRGRGAFRVGALSAAVATAMLLGVAGARGADILTFAGNLGANFKLPGWALVLVSLLLPALQSGGIAGGVARLFREAASRPARAIRA